MATEHLLLAFSLTLFAGLATGIGSALAFFSRSTNTTFLCAALSFSAGAMVYVSFVEIFPKARIALSSMLGDQMGYAVATAAFFGGLILIALIDKMVPHFENPHEMHHIEEMDDAAQKAQFRNLYHMGVLTALAIAIH